MSTQLSLASPTGSPKSASKFNSVGSKMLTSGIGAWEARQSKTEVERDLFAERKERKLLQVEVDSAKEELIAIRIQLKEAEECKYAALKEVSTAKEEKRRLETKLDDEEIGKAQIEMSLENLVGDKDAIAPQVGSLKSEADALEGQLDVHRKAKAMMQQQGLHAMNEVANLKKKANMAKIEVRKMKEEYARYEKELNQHKKIIMELEPMTLKLEEQSEAKKHEIEELRTLLGEAQTQSRSLQSEIALHKGREAKEKENHAAAAAELRALEAKQAKLLGMKKACEKKLTATQRERAAIKEHVTNATNLVDDLDEHLGAFDSNEALEDDVEEMFELEADSVLQDSASHQPMIALSAKLPQNDDIHDCGVDSLADSSVLLQKDDSHDCGVDSDLDIEEASVLEMMMEVANRNQDAMKKQSSIQSLSTACPSQRSNGKSLSQALSSTMSDSGSSWLSDFDDRSQVLRKSNTIDWDFKDLDLNSETTSTPSSRRDSFSGQSTPGSSNRQVQAMTWPARDQKQPRNRSLVPASPGEKLTLTSPPVISCHRAVPGATSPPPVHRPRSDSVSSASRRSSSAAPKWY